MEAECEDWRAVAWNIAVGWCITLHVTQTGTRSFSGTYWLFLLAPQ